VNALLGAPPIRDRFELFSLEGPGSAAHHFMLRCARDTQPWLGITRAQSRAARRDFFGFSRSELFSL
jgi:hypothetical protein